MNRRISDLLDNIQEDSIDLRESTPLSSDRIKELTMSKIEHNNNAKQKKARTMKGTVSKILIAAILICSLAVTASATGYSSQAANNAHGQILDKGGNVLKDVPLIKNVEPAQGDVVTTDIILLRDGNYAYQGDDVTTDIVLLDDGNYIYNSEEIQETAISTEADWWKRFNSLTPDQQAKISFRPNAVSRESSEILPQETTER